MSGADTRLATTHQLVEQDGPRILWRSILAGSYTATCSDCDSWLTATKRIDAEDWLDRHDCNAPEPRPGAWS